MRIMNGIELPTTYQKLEFIENAGTAWIDTTISAANKKFIIDMQFTSNETRQLMGTSPSSSAYWGNNKGTWEKVGITGANKTTLDRVKLHFDVGNITAERTNTWLEGATNKFEGSDPNWATTAARTFKLFNLAGSGYNCKMKLYGLIVQDANGNIVNNCIPCKRVSDNKYGLYDIVNSSFISGSGTFSTSPAATKTASCKVAAVAENYDRLEYIQSSGTQYIDLDYVCKANNIKIELDMMWTGTSVGAFETFVGFMYSSSQVTPRIGLHKYSSNLMFGANATTTASPTITPVKDERFTYTGEFVSGAQKMYKNGTLAASNTTTFTFSTNTCPTYIFARYCPNSMNYATMRLYSCKIWEGTTLVRHYVPAKNNNTNKVGLLEILNRKFYLNSGSGEFTYATKSDLAVIPDEYQQVEYIQATGTQRIKLDIQPTSKYKIEETFAITDRTVTSCIWCARGTTTGNLSTTAFNIANSQLRCDYGSSAAMNNAGTLNANQIYTLTMDSEKWYLDGVLKTSMSAATFTSGSKLQLLASHYNGIDSNLGNYAKLKLYRFRVWDADRLLVGDFIPAYRKADNVIGLYDTCGKTFYVNNGSGTFLKGDLTFGSIRTFKPFAPTITKLPGIYKQLDYIEATGTQYINTNIIPTIAKETLVEGAFALTDTTAGNAQSIGVNMNINFYAASNLSVFRPCGYQTTIPLDLNKHTYSLQLKSAGRYITLDSNSFVGSIPASLGNYTFCLGAMNGGSSMYYGKYKIYRTKIYNSDSLVRDLVPCLRRLDNKLGMYDLIDKQFYPNAGTGVFTAGNAAVEVL